VAGAVRTVDKTAKTVGLKTADGTEETFKYSEKTTVHGAHDVGKAAQKGALDTYFAGKVGTHVVVRYTVKGADKTANSVEDRPENDDEECAREVPIESGPMTLF
jgi:hypothetical protein